MDIRKETVLTKKKSVRKNTLNALLTETGFATGGFLAGLATLPFGATPFGFALLCCSGKHTLSILAGVCLSALMHTDRAMLLAAYALVTILRIALSVPYAKRQGGTYDTGLFSEPPSLRVMTAALGAFLVGLPPLIQNGFLYYHLFGILLSTSVAALGAFLWRALPLIEPQARQVKGSVLKTLAWLTACAVAVYALRGYSVYGVSLSALLCMLISLTATHKKGISLGALAAIFSGLPLSVTYTPLFVFAAICYGFLSSVRISLGCFAAFGVAVAWGINTGGLGFISSTFSAITSACLLFFVTVKLFDQDEVKEQNEDTVSPSPQPISATPEDIHITAARLDDTSRKIKALCQGLSSISDTLLTSDTYILHSKDEEYPLTDVYSAEFGEETVIAHSGAIPIKSGKKYKDISSEINHRISAYSSVATAEDRTESCALDLRFISDCLANIMAENDSEYVPDVELGKKVADSLASAFPRRGLTVCALGQNRKRLIIGCGDSDYLEKNAADIRRHIETVCDLRLTAEEPFDIGNSTYLTFYQRPVLDTLVCHRSKKSVCETDFCGDSVGVIDHKQDGKLFAYISDGMGSGEKAAVTSQLCSLFLQKLLPINCTHIGNTRVSGSSHVSGDKWIRATIEMLNGFLRSRGGVGENECSATVDLGVLDLVNGKISMYKSGAAPTYVFRDGSLFKLGAQTMPIGIIKEPDIGRINMELLPDDVIVMISDGVTGGREECPELFELLRSRITTHSAEQLADEVIKYAVTNDSPDDISVIVMKVQEKLFEN